MRKAFQKNLYSFLVTKWGVALCLIGALLTLNTALQLIRTLIGHEEVRNLNQVQPFAPKGVLSCKEDPIDIVYTWVNGSDPRHRASVETEKRRHDPHGQTICKGAKAKNDTCHDDQVSASRFVDNEELRYSLRSIEKFAPWARNVYLVTSGQIPYWLNVDHPRLKVVSHAEIFQNQSHLPTFSSPAIETHLHRLPGLSDKFVYLNDDVMFGNEVWPEDFYTRSNGQKVYLSWAVPNCKDGCPSNWIGDKYCDAACNHPECDFDGGDCINATANTNRWWGGGKKWSPPAPPAHQPAGNNAPNTNGHAPPPPANYGSRFAANYCAKSCPDSWVGDKYCDRSCQNADCGFDAGDCGVEMLFHGLFGANITNQTTTITAPSGLTAMYFNLSGIVRDGKIIDGSHDNAILIRTATISQKNKVMTLTFHRNITQQDVSISITVEFNKTQEETVFNLTAGTYVPPTMLNVTSNSTQSSHTTTVVATQPLTSLMSTEMQRDLSSTDTPGIPTEDKPKAFLAPQAEPPSQGARNQEQVGTPPSIKEHDTMAEPAVAFSTDPSAVFAGGQSEPEVEQPREDNQRLVVAKANAVEPQLQQQGHGEGNEEVSNASGQRKLLAVEEMGQNTLKGNGSEVLKKKLRTTRIITKIRRRKSSSSSSPKGLGAATTNQRRKDIGIKINNSTRSVLTWREMTSLKQEFLKQEMVDIMVEEYREWYTQMKLQKQKWIEEEDTRRKAMKTLEVPEEEGIYPWEADKYLITSGSHERDPAVAKHFSRRKLLDLFGDSLKFVDRLYSRTFGSAARKVPAHMPHMIDKNKMAELQSRWPDLWDATSSHQFRASNDMQYAFSYMYFIIHQKREFDIQTHWTEDLDVDHDGVLNKNELRTLSIKINGQPVQDKHLEELEHALIGNTTIPIPIDYKTLVSCTSVIEKLQKHYTSKGKNKYEILGTDEVAFLMVNENYAKTQKSLDGIRERRQKFICLNDNMNHTNPDSQKTVAVLREFYESIFAVPSTFELPADSPNHILYIDELRADQENRHRQRVILYATGGVLLLVVFCALLRYRQLGNRIPYGRERRLKEQRFKRLLSI